MELCNDANFFETQLDDKKKEIKDENLLKCWAKDILTAVKEMHDANIIHADLKLPNLLLHKENDEDIPIVKVCDFGISQIITPNQFGGLRKALMKERSGTCGYIAPEIRGANQLIGPEVDMWAFGIILYQMCVAYKPTQLKGYKYGTGPIPYNKRDWKKLSEGGAPI